jgi:small-conductance mechanosensitive channel
VLDAKFIASLEQAFATPRGWSELGVIALSLFIAWLIDRRIRLRTENYEGLVRLGLGGLNRVIFPASALVLTALARAAYSYWSVPLFLKLAIPLLAAAAVARASGYLLRSLFAPSGWLRASERAISLTIWTALILHLTGALRPVLQVLDENTLVIGKHEISVMQILSAALLISVTLLLSLWISQLIEARLMRAERLDSSTRVVLSKFLRALLMVIAVFVALAAVGIDLTVLSVFGGALGVGLGLGLQKLASNYLSGFTILLDRSIRLNDIITIDNRTGLVTGLNARYVVLRMSDGIEAIVPNEQLVVNVVLNHSHSDRKLRAAISVTIAGEDDVRLAMRLMEEVGTAHPRALRGEDAPRAFVLRLADNGIELELGVWINDPEQGLVNLRSELLLAVLETFRTHGIHLPAPQREVRLVRRA